MNKVQSYLADVRGDLLDLDGAGLVLTRQTRELWADKVCYVVYHLVPASRRD